MARSDIELFMDSGAFNVANRKGPPLSLTSYISFLKKCKGSVYAYANMDVIPEHRTPTELAASAKKSYANLQTMKSHGLTPVPVFHKGEQFHWLERMLKDGEKHIGVSAKDGTAEWLQHFFKVVGDIKVHGFGITRSDYMMQFPFTSVDSTSWMLHAAYGNIIVPALSVDGSFNYLSPIVINVTSDFETMGDLQRAAVQKFISTKVKTTISDIRYNVPERYRACLVYYMQLEQQLGKRIMFSADVDHPLFSHVLTLEGAKGRLLSFYDTQHVSADEIKHYATTGIFREYTRRVPKQHWNEEYVCYRSLAQIKRLERLEKKYG